MKKLNNRLTKLVKEFGEQAIVDALPTIRIELQEQAQLAAELAEFEAMTSDAIEQFYIDTVADLGLTIGENNLYCSYIQEFKELEGSNTSNVNPYFMFWKERKDDELRNDCRAHLESGHWSQYPAGLTKKQERQMEKDYPKTNLYPTATKRGWLEVMHKVTHEWKEELTKTV